MPSLHTFEKLRFHFQFQSEPTFDQTSWYGHKEQESLKLHYLLMSYSKTLVFKILLPLVVVCSVSTSVTQKPDTNQR